MTVPAPPVVADIASPPSDLPSHPAEAADSPWPRLRRSFAMQGCDYRPEVQRWAQTYARGPRQFAASWKEAMPLLLMVVDELHKRDLPGEFAMLPYVESTYRPLPSRGDHAAGMWQMVPDTARAAGLEIGAEYDGRLDPVASTAAALDLLAHYRREFADWRLVDMAFNGGEFRVKKLLDDRDPRDLSADELARLPFNQGTHEHLDRLLALSCIVQDPARFGITLPEPAEDDHLQTVTLAQAMDLRLVARLAGLNADQVRRWNAGYRRNRMVASASYRVLLPANRVERLHAASSAIPLQWWSDWREERAARTSTLATWAGQAGVPVSVLALANAVPETSTVTSSSRLLLPGREPQPLADAGRRPAHARVHVVKSGDTLSRIAQRYDLPLKDLRRLNPGAGGTLHLGDRLRVGLAGAD